jgi:hypothetical protein
MNTGEMRKEDKGTKVERMKRLLVEFLTGITPIKYKIQLD